MHNYEKDPNGNYYDGVPRYRIHVVVDKDNYEKTLYRWDYRDTQRKAKKNLNKCINGEHRFAPDKGVDIAVIVDRKKDKIRYEKVKKKNKVKILKDDLNV